MTNFTYVIDCTGIIWEAAAVSNSRWGCVTRERKDTESVTCQANGDRSDVADV